LEARVDALRQAHLALLKFVHLVCVLAERWYLTSIRVTKVYENESYDYPTQIQESISELSTTIGHGITNFAATNLKGTNLPTPSPVAPQVSQHKTLPHALGRAATNAAAAVQRTPGGNEDKLGKALTVYADVFDNIASARVEQDESIQSQYLRPWQTTLSTSINVAMKARQAVRVSRLELDAAKQTSLLSPSLSPSSVYIFLIQPENYESRQARAGKAWRWECRGWPRPEDWGCHHPHEDSSWKRMSQLLTSMTFYLIVCSQNLWRISMNLWKLRYVSYDKKVAGTYFGLQLLYFAAAAEALSSAQGEIEELSVAAEGEYR
jgi:hypothetical protein